MPSDAICFCWTADDSLFSSNLPDYASSSLWVTNLERPRPVVTDSKAATGRKPRRAVELGVTDAEYARLLSVQGGGCAICGAKPKTRRLHVDHDHRTGAVRGLLCHRCNRNLPTWVTERWLFRAAAYLARADAA